MIEDETRDTKNNTFTNKFNIWTAKTSSKNKYFEEEEDEFSPTIKIQRKQPFVKKPT